MPSPQSEQAQYSLKSNLAHHKNHPISIAIGSFNSVEEASNDMKVTLKGMPLDLTWRLFNGDTDTGITLNTPIVAPPEDDDEWIEYESDEYDTGRFNYLSNDEQYLQADERTRFCWALCLAAFIITKLQKDPNYEGSTDEMALSNFVARLSDSLYGFEMIEHEIGQHLTHATSEEIAKFTIEKLIDIRADLTPKHTKLFANFFETGDFEPMLHEHLRGLGGYHFGVASDIQLGHPDNKWSELDGEEEQIAELELFQRSSTIGHSEIQLIRIV